MKPLRYCATVCPLALALSVLLLGAAATAQVNQDWLQVYEGTSIITNVSGAKTADLAVDGEGNVYVATVAEEADGIYTQGLLVKYGPDGTLLWSRTHDGVAMGYDAFTAIALGEAQGVVVTGWEQYEGENGVRFDQIVTNRYDRATGDLVWSRTYDGFEQGDVSGRGTDRAVAIAVDGTGGVYVAGTSYQTGSQFNSEDLILIKYNAAGDLQWVQTYDGTAGTGVSSDNLTGMALDVAGNAFLIGTVDSGYVVHKYAPDGSPQWFQFYDSDYSDVPVAVALDPEGNVIVTGTSSTDCANTCRDYLTIKYSPAGTPLWTARFDNGHGTLRNDDWAAALAVDASGNIYVTGRSQQADASFFDYLTVKYSPAGDTLWTRRYDGPVNEHDNAYAIALDDEDNVYVSGVTGIGGGVTDSEYGTIKYSPAGDSLWFVMKVPATNGSHDYPTANTVDADGNVYVTGYQELFSSANLITVKYTQSGPTPVEDGAPTPTAVRLLSAYPNPFGDRTTIRYTLPEPARVRLTVYDVLGREVTVLVDEEQPAGDRAVTFDGTGLPAGLYVYRLEAGADEATGRTVLTH